jgi:antirestriction protein ArdC
VNDALNTIIETIISELDKGVAPWRQPWINGARPGLPLRSDGLPFSGMNAILLSMLQSVHGYRSAYWLTFNQAKALGGNVRKGEKSASAILYKTRVLDGEVDDSGDERILRFLKTYHVFSADQIDGLPEALSPLDSDIETVLEPLVGDIAHIMEHFPVRVVHGGNRACYSVEQDIIRMPPREAFENDEYYITTLLHEYGHSTGAKHRLNRNMINHCPEDYAREELVAELTSHLTSLHLGLNPTQSVFQGHVAYLGYWAKLLKDRPGELLKAAGKAQMACDMILKFRYDQRFEDVSEVALTG